MSVKTDETGWTASASGPGDTADAGVRRQRLWLGFLALAVGVPLGVGAEWRTQLVIEHAWSYCVDMAWVPTYEMAPDATRFGLFTWWFYLLVYAVGFPVGLLLVVGRSQGRVSGRRIVAGCVAGLLVLAVVSAADLSLNVAPKDGYYLPARCPAGHPSWWPGWLPISGSGGDRPMDLGDMG